MTGASTLRSAAVIPLPISSRRSARFAASAWVLSSRESTFISCRKSCAVATRPGGSGRLVMPSSRRSPSNRSRCGSACICSATAGSVGPLPGVASTKVQKKETGDLSGSGNAPVASAAVRNCSIGERSRTISSLEYLSRSTRSNSATFPLSAIAAARSVSSAGFPWFLKNTSRTIADTPRRARLRTTLA